jgi:HK97 family phage prohead protease
MNIERSALSGEIIETKQVEINGVPIGVVLGHVATWQTDNSNGIFGIPDRIVRGAYLESLQEHKARHNRQIRLKNHHMHVIGGFPIELAKEDNIGLFAEGHINLETKEGVETYSLARQKVLVDFSVGHIVLEDKIEDGERVILKARIIEASIVDEPKNQRAQITEVKNLHFADLPIAMATTGWDEDSARARVMELKFADGNGADAFIGDNLIADVIEGKLVAIPAALNLAAQEVKESGDKGSQVVLERYFGKMEVKSPFDSKQFYTVDDVRKWTNAEFKSALITTGIFSNGAVRALVARSKGQVTVPEPETKAMGSLLENIRATTLKIAR